MFDVVHSFPRGIIAENVAFRNIFHERNFSPSLHLTFF